MKFNSLEIAEIIHGATCRINRADGSKVCCWEDLTDFQKNSAAKAVAKIYSEPQRTPKELHELWMEPLIENGWTYGEFSVDNKQHPSLLPFEELIESEILKDYIWSHLTEAFRDFYLEY
jgi:hypothetical protein